MLRTRGLCVCRPSLVHHIEAARPALWPHKLVCELGQLQANTMLRLAVSAAVAQGLRAVAPRALASASRASARPHLFRPVRPAAARQARQAATAASGGATAALAPGNATAELADAYNLLQGCQMYRVSTPEAPVDITTLWSEGERAVVMFARHMVRRGASVGAVGAAGCPVALHLVCLAAGLRNQSFLV